MRHSDMEHWRDGVMESSRRPAPQRCVSKMVGPDSVEPISPNSRSDANGRQLLEPGSVLPLCSLRLGVNEGPAPIPLLHCSITPPDKSLLEWKPATSLFGTQMRTRDGFVF